jgi:hypothetical protein
MSSSLSADDPGCIQLEFNIDLVSLGGNGCGIEVSNGIVYSIGTQYITFTSSSQCLNNVLINGLEPPVLVNDGEQITIEPIIDSSCNLISVTNPTCATQQMFFLRNINGKKTLFVRKKALQNYRRNFRGT